MIGKQPFPDRRFTCSFHCHGRFVGWARLIGRNSSSSSTSLRCGWHGGSVAILSSTAATADCCVCVCVWMYYSMFRAKSQQTNSTNSTKQSINSLCSNHWMDNADRKATWTYDLHSIWYFLLLLKKAQPNWQWSGSHLGRQANRLQHVSQGTDSWRSGFPSFFYPTTDAASNAKHGFV